MTRLIGLAMILVFLAAPANASEIDDFSASPAHRWDFFTDQVMGGVSSGGVTFPEGTLRLSGSVSTANNGGFIQARLKLPHRLPESATALVLRVKGNGDTYYMHLRTGGTLLPWHYYQSPFPTSGTWTEVRLPLTAFKPSTWMVRRTPAPGSVRSIAIVAFGHDHAAEVSVDWIGWE